MAAALVLATQPTGDAANCVLYMALAEASYALGDGQALSEGAEGLRRAAMDELRRRGELA